MRAIGVTLLFLTCLLLLGTLSHPANARPITALALTADKDGTYPLDAKVAAYFKEQGITIIGRPLNQPLSREMLRQFDCVLLTTFMGLRAPWFSQPNSVSDYFTLKANLAEISAYVEQGGGLFFLPEFGWAGAEAAQTMGALLDPWGLRVEASSPYDKAHAWQGYGWTTNIAKSPVTANVKTLFYPMILGRWDDLYPTNTLVITGCETLDTGGARDARQRDCKKY